MVNVIAALVLLSLPLMMVIGMARGSESPWDGEEVGRNRRRH